jgi:hypothetical protein
MDETVESSVTLTVSSAVRDGEVDVLVTRSSYWMDSAAARNKMRIGFDAAPSGNMIVSIPVEGVEEGQKLTPEQLSQFLQENMKSLFGTVHLFIEESQSDF